MEIVARQMYGNQEQYKQARDEPVEYVTGNKRYFSAFSTNIDERQAEQLYK